MSKSAASAALFISQIHASPLALDEPARGWMLLSSSEEDARVTIAAASSHGINQLQLSHQIVHNLRELREDARCARVNRLIDAAHDAGIREVALWDHAFYSLSYYPDEFRTGPGRTLDLDNPAFWEWFKQDYRNLLDRVPGADAVVLTFIETGARAERQHSTTLKTDAEKLAAVVNAVADVVVGERALNLYARTFSYTHEEYARVIAAVGLIERPEVRLMMKETPHDFFLTHPNDTYAGRLPGGNSRPTLMEFDIAGEFHGQGIVANTWPEYVLRRWRDFASRKHIIGAVARTDRYGDTRLVGRPGEINLLALSRGLERPNTTADEIHREFITGRYGAAALPAVQAAFQHAFEIATCTFYTLGTNIANHSALDYDPYASSYVLHVSGKWFDPPVVRVGHGVDREFHYWRDVVNHLAPPFIKEPGNKQWLEVPWVREAGWIQPGEGMTEEFLRYILQEKDHGVALAEESLSQIAKARDVLRPTDFEDLHHYFHRTLLTARLHRATAAAYFGFRVWSRGEGHRTAYVHDTVHAGLSGLKEVAKLIRDYPAKPPVGQWNWEKDAQAAERYFRWITEDGWPAKTRGFANPHAGMTFPFRAPMAAARTKTETETHP